MRVFYILFLSLLIQNLVAQSGLQASYSFDACNLSDQSGLSPDAIAAEALDCQCGVVSSGIQLGNGLDSITFDSSLIPLFSDDFTLSFYVKLINPVDRVDIFSIQSDECMVDSSLIIRYNNISEQFSVEIGERLENVIELYADLDPDVCWHHIVFSKSAETYFLYYNGVLAEERAAVKSFLMDPMHNMSISSSGCLGIIDSPFSGVIDEFKVYNRFLTSIELEALNEYPDLIINQDTTIFLGDALQIVSGESCSTAPSWTPIDGVDNPTMLDPILTPTETTTYTLNLPGATCSTQDLINVNVIDLEELDCTDLLLPNAFTPNGDNLNDVFGISNEFIIDELKRFDIYDRWGERVFSTVNKNVKWDATFKGKEVNPAMFLYVIGYTCKDDDYVKSGNISVLR